MTSRGAACRLLACPWTPCYPACLSDVPASGVPVAVFVPVSAAAGRVSARVAGAVAVVSGRSVAGVVAGVVVQRFAEPLSAVPEPVAARPAGAVDGVADQRFAEALSAAPEPAARLAGAAAADFDRLSAFLRRQHRSAESSAAP